MTTLPEGVSIKNPENLFLASDEASFITGVDLFVDGGSVELR